MPSIHSTVGNCQWDMALVEEIKGQCLKSTADTKPKHLLDFGFGFQCWNEQVFQLLSTTELHFQSLYWMFLLESGE